MKKQNSAYFLSHNGLGDNITSIGAINYLLNYYETIYFLCKDIYNDNVKILFENKPVITIPFDSKNETNECAAIISKAYNLNDDVFICGFHTSYLKSKITHPDLLQYVKNDNNYSIKYKFIKDFYNDINLDLNIYYTYFDINSSEISLKYYNEIKNYKIVFLHTKSSTKEIYLDDLVNLYIDKDDYIIICANKNLYNVSNIKHNLAEQYVNIKVAYYIDVIKNAEIIHIIDSCFSCIVYPLYESRKIQPTEFVIHERQ